MPSNPLWQPEEIAIIADAMDGRIPVEELPDRLPGRSARAIYSKLGRRPDRIGERTDSLEPTGLDPDDDGYEDGELTRRRLRARLGNALMLKRLAAAGFMSCP